MQLKIMVWRQGVNHWCNQDRIIGLLRWLKETGAEMTGRGLLMNRNMISIRLWQDRLLEDLGRNSRFLCGIWSHFMILKRGK